MNQKANKLLPRGQLLEAEKLGSPSIEYLIFLVCALTFLYGVYKVRYFKDMRLTIFLNYSEGQLVITHVADYYSCNFFSAVVALCFGLIR